LLSDFFHDAGIARDEMSDPIGIRANLTRENDIGRDAATSGCGHSHGEFHHFFGRKPYCVVVMFVAVVVVIAVFVSLVAFVMFAMFIVRRMLRLCECRSQRRAGSNGE
jgi:hypothetical protein